MLKREEGRLRHLESLDEEGRRNVIARMQTNDAQEKRVASLKNTLATPEAKAKKSNASKLSWQDPKSRANRMEGLQKAALKRKKPKQEKVPYDNNRRSEAMRKGWIKRKMNMQHEL